MKCFKSIFIRFSIFSSHIYKSRLIFKGFGVHIYKFVHECIKPYSLNSYGYEHTYMAVLRQILNRANQICLLKQLWKNMKTHQVIQVCLLQPPDKRILSDIGFTFSICTHVHPAHPTPGHKNSLKPFLPLPYFQFLPFCLFSSYPNSSFKAVLHLSSFHSPTPHKSPNSSKSVVDLFPLFHHKASHHMEVLLKYLITLKRGTWLRK